MRMPHSTSKSLFQLIPWRIWCMALFLLVFACKSEERLVSKAISAFDLGEYEQVIQSLKPLIGQAQANQGQVHYFIAESYRLSNRLAQAIPYYEKALSANYPDLLIPYHLAFAHKLNGSYAQAAQYLELFIKSKPSKNWRLRAELEKANLPEIEALKQKIQPVEVSNMEGNTPMAEFAPRLYEGDLVVSASRKGLIYKNNGQPFLGLYRAALKQANVLGEFQLFSSNLFVENANEGTPAFSKDGKLMVFARGNTGKSKDASPDVDLYLSKKEDGQWSQPERLSISDSLAWDGSPAFSSDGKTLYFASNRRGGKGGLDLYRVGMDNSGRFGRAINMGSAINTAGDEMFPFVSEDGKLYFASDGHPGLGGLDLFVATRNGNDIEVEHLGLPMNSSGDDFGLVMVDERQGYFSSNRSGGKGDDDLYYFKGNGLEDRWWSKESLEPPAEDKVVRYYLLPKFVDVNGKALAAVNYSIKRNGENLGASKSDKSGKGTVLDLGENDEMEFLASKEDYLSKRSNFSMEGRQIPKAALKKALTDTTFEFVVIMDKPEIGKEITQWYQINPIYYDLDKSDIRNDAAEELDKIVQFLKDNEQVVMELGSHTDARATAAYNLKLSQRRAESAVRYIVSKGIEPDRIKAKGYGETQLINECADGVNCSEEMHQQNRRTEFVITDLKTP